MPRARSRLAATCLTLGLCLASAIPGAGAADRGASTPSPFGYALSAVRFRSFFVFDARPGQTVRGVLRVTNLTPAAKTIVLYPGFVSTAATGGLQYNHSKLAGVAKWLHLSRRSVHLQGPDSVDVPFTVRLPAKVRAGDLFGGIIAVDRRVLTARTVGHGTIQLRIIPRLAMTIQLRVPGPRAGRLAVGAAAIHVAPSGAWLTLRVTNLGNVLLPATTGNVTVYQGSNALFSQGVELAPFVPRTHISFQVPWNGRPVEGTYEVKGQLRPTGAPAVSFERTVVFARAKIKQYRSETGRPATASSSTSPLLIVALVLAAVGVVVFATAYFRLRGRMRGGGGAPS